MNSTKFNKRGKHKKELKIYDDKLSQEIAEIIEKLTHTGKKTLNIPDVNRIKEICRSSDKYVKEAYCLIINNLEEKHSEVRLSAFQICDEIFRSSHCFREQVICNLEKLVELTTDDSLPPPLRVARELKQVALRAIHEWNGAFGNSYKKLSLGYNYLRNVKRIDFNTLNVVDDITRARQQENERRKEAINRERIKKVLVEIKDKKMDIKLAVTTLSNCINLLLPHPDDFFIATDDGGDDDISQVVVPTPRLNNCRNTSSDSDEDLQDTDLREVGMTNFKHTIELNFTPNSEACIDETPENIDIIDNAREQARLIGNKYLPTVKVWLEVLSKSTGHEEEQKSLIELKGDLDDVMFKYGRMTFTSANDISSDSELEEVPSLPELVTDVQKTDDPTVWSILSKETTGEDPTSVQNQLPFKKEPSENPLPSTSSHCEVDSSTSESQTSIRKQKLLAVAPKLPFDVDLYHWEDEKLPIPTLLPSSTEGHRFWIGSEDCMDELPMPEGSAALRTRVIEFTGSFTPVKHSCRVRLPSGKLCPRRDRQKCPFHGEIVPRDETGKCIDLKDEMRIQELAEKRQQEKPDWQDPKLLAEIKKATGMDLKMPEKGKRRKIKKEYPGLTNLKESENTVTKRLQKKIFKKSAMRKVASAMDKMDQRKFNDKFSDQFQYFYNS